MKDQRAPGRLEALRLFINTADLENPERDTLASAAAAGEWLQGAGLLPEGDLLAESDLAKTRAVREALRSELLAHNGDGDPAECWRAVCTLAGDAELTIRCSDEPGELDLEAAGSGAKLVIGRLYAIMYDAIRSKQWQRLKACRKHSCLWAFYDHSKNGSGAWCDMAICGNRLKAQRRRRRQAPSRPA